MKNAGANIAKISDEFMVLRIVPPYPIQGIYNSFEIE